MDLETDPPSAEPAPPAPVAEEGPDRLYVQAVEKAFRVLEAFSAATGPLSLSRLAGASGLDKSGVQRMAHTLCRLGYLEQTPGGLSLGHRFLERSFDYLRLEPLVRRAYPVLSELRSEAGQRVDFSRFDDLQVVFLMRMPARRQAFYAYLAGRRLPTFCTAGGRAAMSRLAPAAARDIVDRSDRRLLTPRTIVAPEEIMRLVDQARADGFALSADETQMGEVVLAAPVLDEAGRPVGAIHIAGSLGEWTPEGFAGRFAPMLVDAANSVSFF